MLHENYYIFKYYQIIPIDCEEGDIRLTGSDHHFEGFVEICLDKMWGLVSQSGWNDNDAKVICMQLGYSGNG